MKNKYYLYLSCGMLLILSIACAKQITTTEIPITRTDTVIVNTIDTVLSPATPLTIFIIRHAEKQTGTNPSLTVPGEQRANELARFLEQVSLDAIYSSNYKRTQETALPTSTEKNTPITNYDPGKLPDLAKELLATQSGKTILLIGHSNTNPDLINIFTQTKDYPHLSEKEYDDIFLLRVHSLGSTEVLRLKYGVPSE